MASVYYSDEDNVITGGERLNFDPPPPVLNVEIASQENTENPPKKKKKDNRCDEAGNATAINNRTTHAIAQDEIANNNLILSEIDLETCGENVGVVQILCIAHEPNQADFLEAIDSLHHYGKSANISHN